MIANARRLKEAAGLLGVPVLLTEQNPDALGGTVPGLAGGETIAKMEFDVTRQEAFLDRVPAGAEVAVSTHDQRPDVAHDEVGAAARGPGKWQAAGAVAAELAGKFAASAMHLGFTRNGLIALTGNMAGKGMAGAVAARVIAALGTAGEHFPAETVVKSLVTNAVGLVIQARKPGEVFPDDDGEAQGTETPAALRARMPDARPLGKVGNAFGDAAGALAFGIAQGIATALGRSGMGDRALLERLDGALAEIRPREIPDGRGGRRMETLGEVSARIAHDVVVGRAIPILQGGALQTVVAAAFKAAGADQAGSAAPADPANRNLQSTAKAVDKLQDTAKLAADAIAVTLAFASRHGLLDGLAAGSGQVAPLTHAA